MRLTRIDLEDFKNENSSLLDKNQSLCEEKTRLGDKSQQLEHQLVTVMEKNKICQIEVGQRDQAIMKLQNELSLAQEKYSAAVEETQLHRDELERLNQRIRQQSADLDEMRSSNDTLESRRTQLDRELKQLQIDYEITQQEVSKREKQLENVKLEWTNNIRHHEDEVRSYKQSYQILNDELTHTKTELQEVLVKINDLKHNLNVLNSELEAKNEENENARDEIDRLNETCRNYENKLYSYTNDLSAAKGQLENVNAQLNHFKERLDETQGRYEQALNTIDELEHSVQFLNETISDYKNRVIYRLI